MPKYTHHRKFCIVDARYFDGSPQCAYQTFANFSHRVRPKEVKKLNAIGPDRVQFTGEMEVSIHDGRDCRNVTVAPEHWILKSASGECLVMSAEQFHREYEVLPTEASS